ncbi:hypothetical protein [Polaribacter sp. 20A6]|uniref:hypothetical protein n=1 Tax=Polaribacter sp. 20A6 TaxID=2687289 RepID=UPI0013FD5932|nr:hypothetical protein [Polaribacter sp. 20A6]
MLTHLKEANLLGKIIRFKLNANSLQLSTLKPALQFRKAICIKLPMIFPYIKLIKTC